MNITISKDQLALGLRRILTVVSSRTTLPALNNVLLEAEGENLILTATDLEVSVRTSLPAFVEEPGATTVPAKKFGQIISSLTGGDVSLKTDETQSTSISSGRSFFRIVGLDAEEFPRDSEFSEEWSFDLPADVLRKSFLKVSFASSVDETRHVLNGTLMSIRNGIMTVAATDGRRLALLERPLESESIPDGDAILPPKVVAEIEKTMEGDKNVRVRLSESRIAFDLEHTRITSKLVEGNYPNYRQVVPENFTQSVTIPRVEFGDVINRVSMVVSESSAAVKLKLTNAEMTISATSNEFGEAKEPVDVSYEGEPLEIAFNPVFFTDPLRNLECDQLIMQFNDEYSPVALSGDEGFLYVVMPMRG
jgi:DNA polymerase-3 subunit beta